MPKILSPVDLSVTRFDQAVPGHNRWHPEIPAIDTVEPGEVFRLECLDWLDGQIKNNDDPSDVRDVDLSVAHVLSGPVAVRGAEPGDLLVVDILDIGTLPDMEWGFTGIFARENGGGFLTDVFPEAAKAIWDFSGIYATSRHIPGVRFAGITHPGLIGCAPSHELLAKWNAREQALIDTAPDRVPPLANPPVSDNALLGQVSSGSPDYARIAAEGARTVPPREHGGNCDIKNLSRGSRLYLPVYVPGGNLSVGDLHFSQGDGEISFCGAIEMAGWIDLKAEVIKGGVERYAITNPIFKPGPVEPHYSEYLVFEGISVDENGEQHYLDTNLAYRNACLNAISYLQKFGFTPEQAYLLMSCAPIEGRISGIVDVPNACCTLAIPTAIFETPITPS
ncbi:formamidase [Amycolatopsis alkalitolerans]|uniref:Acetamidase/formamidase family protein n=1 Tax=Amycolatopsis alkalitolerans TaxID=2547244 RepID=A0A5C4LT23_9PSEU|nr:formamidase [Amycolatopsis alkalitolerans]TNC22208.1 acetamidase/formamidase family protein [Amycolatopsis alkalitolerans]